MLAAKPETVRFYLQYGYNWIPAGAWLAAAYLVWRGRDPQARDRDVAHGPARRADARRGDREHLRVVQPVPERAVPGGHAVRAAAGRRVLRLGERLRVRSRPARAVAAVGTLFIAVLALASAGL